MPSSLIERVHGSYIHRRRVRTLRDHILNCLDPDCRTLLDVGCGDGLLSSVLVQRRPDLSVTGIDVLVRPATPIPVQPFDGRNIPFPDRSFDTVLFVDVLHHTDDPMVLLREAARVARRSIVIKDHTMDGPFARATLRYMDRVGNGRYGVALPYNYWPTSRWNAAFTELGLKVARRETSLGLYPVPLNWVFGRSLHFVARLDVPAVAPHSASHVPAVP